MAKKEKESIVIRDIFSHKQIRDNGDIIDISIQEVKKSEDYPEGVRYSLVYVRDGKNLVRYDNYMGHGHHKHIGNRRKEYEFKDEWQLFSDFEEDLNKLNIRLD
ncbi:hypothetical protein CMO93_05510 [Candidatus Woesearchaeota archaeon]|nr:hypothetical protein [Candidatus Woesearchaeota archaeon]|tara:strand:+ start:4254 stop:4565 length:312 start_codon:yes stop_codon:yes gene_type:complete